MIRSMTAYGRAAGIADGKDITVEIKSVNNRYLDCNIKVPRIYSCLEEKIRAHVQNSGVSRGKVDIYIGINVIEDRTRTVLLDEAYSEQYVNALKCLRDKFDLPDDISVMSVAQNRDIFSIQTTEEDLEKSWQTILPFLNEAISMFTAMREREGENLKNDLRIKKENIMSLTKRIAGLSKNAVDIYRSKLEARLRQTLSEMNVELDSARILTECAIFADKVAIDEELVRLNSHFTAFDDCLEASEPVGRKFDFLIQEMNREINTIGSKANDSNIAHLVIEAKCELEKIREQIQNIE